MNIFIYGNQSFKKDIQKILQDSKINEALEDLDIVEIDDIKKLKENIASNPNNVYLIDDDKIIKNKSKFSFLKHKDGIEEEFLLECGVDDLSIDSLEEIPNYIIRKFNRQTLQQEDNLAIKDESLALDLDSELSKLLETGNQEETIVEDDLNIEEPIGLDIKELDNLIESKSIYEDNKNDSNFNPLESFSEDFGLNNISYDYDDDSIYNDNTKSDEDILSDILNSTNLDEDDFQSVSETFEDVNFLDQIFPNKSILEKVIEDKKNEDTYDYLENNFEELENIEPSRLFENIELKDEIDATINQNNDIIEDLEEHKQEIILNDAEEYDEVQGDDMNDEFLELDGLNEQDLISALEDIPNAIIETKNVNSVELDSSNVQDIASLISKLLNNKTLEITIKIKD
ncbi:hypothetical protein [Aliarcobacter vitoriensis]|uniref:Uncharacterized protein n=1 Tax=Aliarcobacter vitoriensis TaxID=2011099 RepID=A0A366MVA9_9BACT|nr:hypothetical protein [Aliarcobacter vitoriensis]RBQ30185.1 hypothetical protein CRU91_00655 [Aliarcobacter vitoriensis]